MVSANIDSTATRRGAWRCGWTSTPTSLVEWTQNASNGSLSCALTASKRYEAASRLVHIIAPQQKHNKA